MSPDSNNPTVKQPSHSGRHLKWICNLIKLKNYSCYFRDDIIGCVLEVMSRHHFPGESDGKASAYNVGDLGSIPGLGRSPGEGNGNPLQYSCLENLMDGGAWLATLHGVTKSQTRLSDFTIYLSIIYHN